VPTVVGALLGICTGTSAPWPSSVLWPKREPILGAPNPGAAHTTPSLAIRKQLPKNFLGFAFLSHHPFHTHLVKNFKEESSFIDRFPCFHT
jgi:hypothetical protein